MRTTLEIDDTVLGAAKEIAQTRGLSAGKIISDWARKGLDADQLKAKKTRAGFPVFGVPAQAKPLTTAMVNARIDDEGAPPRR